MPSESACDKAKETSVPVIPSVDRILRSTEMQDVVVAHGRKATTFIVREIIADFRNRVLSGKETVVDFRSFKIAERAAKRLSELAAPSLKPVLNLTGTVLHTNLGRAPLPSEAIEAIKQVASGTSNLEYNLSQGRRGYRDDHVSDLICQLTGAEAACVVNNNAAAVLLVLNTLARNREGILSRGELVEIGGTFRIPDIMERAGVKLCEVGTTNRTHQRDYESAINENTALIMKVHTSNFEMQGFTASVNETCLSKTAHDNGLPLVVDLGSGALIDLSLYGLPKETTVFDTLLCGVDIVTFSSDKLLGGPQAGIIAGRADLIEKINANPIKRAVRSDKLTIAALSAVLKLYFDPDRLAARLPALRLLTRSYEDIFKIAEQIQPLVAESLKGIASVKIIDCKSQIGSGALPTNTLRSAGLAIKPIINGSLGEGRATKLLAGFAAHFRCLTMPVIGNLRNGSLLLDLRSLEAPEQLIIQLPELCDKLGADK